MSHDLAHDFQAARAEAEERKDRFLCMLELAKERTRPSTLMQSAQDKALDAGLAAVDTTRDRVRSNPIAAIAVVAALAAFIGRKPLIERLRATAARLRGNKMDDPGASLPEKVERGEDGHEK